MADSSESGKCEVTDCRLTEYQTVHKPHTSAHESESESETESRLPDQDTQLQVHVPTPETQNPRPLDCQFEGCEYSTPVGANMNQIIQLMKIHTRQAHPQTKQAQQGPSSLLLGSAVVRQILALTILIALIAVGFGIKETRDSRIATEEWMRVLEVEAKDAKERTDKEARDAMERAEKETQALKERAEKETQEAKERVLKETEAAKERKAKKQEKKPKDLHDKEQKVNNLKNQMMNLNVFLGRLPATSSWDVFLVLDLALQAGKERCHLWFLVILLLVLVLLAGYLITVRSAKVQVPSLVSGLPAPGPGLAGRLPHHCAQRQAGFRGVGTEITDKPSHCGKNKRDQQMTMAAQPGAAKYLLLVFLEVYVSVLDKHHGDLDNLMALEFGIGKEYKRKHNAIVLQVNQLLRTWISENAEEATVENLLNVLARVFGCELDTIKANVSYKLKGMDQVAGRALNEDTGTSDQEWISQLKDDLDKMDGTSSMKKLNSVLKTLRSDDPTLRFKLKSIKALRNQIKSDGPI